MTAEGIFSKIDGDVLYASEVNNIYNYAIPKRYTVSEDHLIDAQTATNISGLVAPLIADRNYLIVANLYHIAATTNQVTVIHISGPQYMSGNMAVISSYNAGNQLWYPDIAGSIVLPNPWDGANWHTAVNKIEYRITTSGTTGSFYIQGRENGAAAYNFTIKKDSYMEVFNLGSA